MNKKVVIGVVVVLVIAAALVFIKFPFKASNTSCEKVENGYCYFGGIPSYLKFQGTDDIADIELYNFSKSTVWDYFILVDSFNVSKGFLCADSNEPPEIVFYFRKVCEEGAEDCEHFRYAVICDDFYVVEDYKESGFGLTKYGPYEL